MLALGTVAFVTFCSRAPDPGYTRTALPRTCDPARFGAAVSAFESVVKRRGEIFARIDALPTDEPNHYLRELEREKEALRALAAEAKTVEVPRCLYSAKEMFGHYMERTLADADLRRPDGDASAYRFALETTEAILSQYQTEVRNQSGNQQ